MKIIRNILMFLGVVFVLGVVINAAQEVTEHVEENVITKGDEQPTDDYNVYALPMPEDLNFAGEKVPVAHPDIRERMDRELLVNTYWQSNGFLMFKRAHKYFPIIEPILQEHGVPDDFKYLAVIESGLTQAVSPARATGFWQLLKGTAREYGLEVNEYVDERYHIEKATAAACKYLLQSKKKFGSWTLAAAAYNGGNGGINKRLTAQKVTSYYDLLLGEETGRYVFRIIALKQILSHPKQYGFNFETKDLYTEVPTFNVLVDHPIADFTSFAATHKINYKILKLHNPWLRKPKLINTTGKEYLIKIPKEGYYTTVTE